MIPFEQALECVRRARASRPAAKIAVEESLGCTLAEDLLTTLPYPHFDNSAMDGFAVGGPSGPWELVGELPAGDSRELILGPCEAIRVFTGARVPSRTFGVIPQEDALVTDGVIQGTVEPKRHIRIAGEEIPPGVRVAHAGQQVTPPVAASLAALGRTSVLVHPKPTLFVLSTGNEVVEPGQELRPGQIFNSNIAAVRSTLRAWGLECQVHHVSDQAEALAEMFDAATASCDVIITTGGVSVGAYDLVRPAAEAAGFEVHFHGVAMKPGKPTAFGVRPDGMAWFGLAGNPMSTWIGLLFFVAEYLGKPLRSQIAHLQAQIEHKPGRLEFCPFVFTEREHIDVISTVGSHSNFALASAKGFIEFPADATHLPAGSEVTAHFFPWSTQT